MIIKNGKKYCECGHKLACQDPNRCVAFHDKLKDDEHFSKCEIHKAVLLATQREAERQTFAEEGCLKLIIGMFIILVGIVMVVIDMCSGGAADITGWGFLVMFIGVGIAVGFRNFVFGSIFGATQDAYKSNEPSAFDIANKVVDVQLQVEARNIGLGRDIFGKK